MPSDRSNGLIVLVLRVISEASARLVPRAERAGARCDRGKIEQNFATATRRGRGRWVADTDNCERRDPIQTGLRDGSESTFTHRCTADAIPLRVPAQVWPFAENRHVVALINREFGKVQSGAGMAKVRRIPWRAAFVGPSGWLEEFESASPPPAQRTQSIARCDRRDRAGSLRSVKPCPMSTNC